jgi:hypothetical protein
VIRAPSPCALTRTDAARLAEERQKEAVDAAIAEYRRLRPLGYRRQAHGIRRRQPDDGSGYQCQSPMVLARAGCVTLNRFAEMAGRASKIQILQKQVVF